MSDKETLIGNSQVNKCSDVATNSEKNSVTILWGQALRKDKPDTYEFDTEEELYAFLHGVEESSGWMEYEILCEMSDNTWQKDSDGTRMVVTSDGKWREEEEDK
tara:strand:+ start:8646 stop:8957 length:312 start_codon:yes stop_codon:yes gene_type:complete